MGAERMRLDCAATMFALGRDARRPYLIRLAATLRQPVRSAVLQDALEATVRCYPYFFVEIVEMNGGLFAVPVARVPRVRRKRDLMDFELDDEVVPCEAQVTYAGPTIFLEYFHGVSDGMGGLTFLMRLVAEYLARVQGDERLVQGVPVASLGEQMEDGYRICARGFQAAARHGGAYRLRGTPAPPRITTYRLSSSEVWRRAQRCSVSVTEYLAVLVGTAAAGVQGEGRAERRSRPVRLSVPVNLRSCFSCRTMRNFTLNVYPELASCAGTVDIGSACKAVHAYMASATRADALAARCAAAVLAEGSALARALPLVVRRAAVRAALDHAPSGSTLTMSNLGVVRAPDAFTDQIAGFELAFSPKPEAPYSCAAVSWGDELRLTLAAAVAEDQLELHLERVLEGERLLHE